MTRGLTVSGGGAGNILNPLIGADHRVTPVKAPSPAAPEPPEPALSQAALADLEPTEAAGSDSLVVAPLLSSPNHRTRPPRASWTGAASALAVIAVLGCGALAVTAAGGSKVISAEARHGLAVAKGQLHRLVAGAKASMER